jgi:hypothetical protein
VNINAFLEQLNTESGFSSWLYEKCSSHPNITKRVRAFDHTGLEATIAAPADVPLAEKTEEEKSDDHSRFMPE